MFNSLFKLIIFPSILISIGIFYFIILPSPVATKQVDKSYQNTSYMPLFCIVFNVGFYLNSFKYLLDVVIIDNCFILINPCV